MVVNISTKGVRNFADTFFKTQEEKEKAYIVEFFDKNNKIVEELSTEFITADPVYRYADKVLKNDKDEIIIVEYQNSILREQDIKRFMVYTALAIEKQELKTKIFIMYTNPIKAKEIWDFGPIIFKPKIFSLKEIDGDKVLKRLKEKIKNKEKLTRHQLHELRFLPFFKSKQKPDEILKQTVKLTNELTGLSKTTIDDLKKGQAILAERFISNKLEKNILMEEIKMKTNIFREIAEEGIKEGKIEGIKQGKIEGIKEGKKEGIKQGIKQTAKRMKNQNFTTEDIIKATGLTKKEIQKL